MDNPNHTPKRKRKQSDGRGILSILAILFIGTAILIIIQAGSRIVNSVANPSGTTPPSIHNQGGTSDPNKPTDPPTTPEPTTPPPPYVVSNASIGVTGDVLVHGPLIKSAQAAAGKTGEYDFTSMYRYIKPYYERYDFMVANLETTLGGTEAGAYKGYPAFNCPDEMVDALKDAGVDMLLTANNHSYDTGYKGFIRTQKVIKEKGLMYLGTQMRAEDVDYVIQNINGIQVGMICYTYETTGKDTTRKYLNGIQLSADAGPLVSSFHYDKLNTFYTEIQQNLEAMEAAGAEATIVFIHWGNEYVLSPNDTQKAIAQKLCELGVDVIVGGHPHVIEPFTTLVSSSGEKTYCIYSLGNALSNQNRISLDETPNKEYTEDGMIFGVTFQKWSDGKVEISEIDILPTWVNRESTSTVYKYAVIPLDADVAVWDSFEVSTHSRLEESYNRTMSLIGKGLNLCREDLGLEAVPTSVEDK